MLKLRTAIIDTPLKVTKESSLLGGHDRAFQRIKCVSEQGFPPLLTSVASKILVLNSKVLRLGVVKL